MSYTTLSGRLSTDPYFDSRSLRSDYYDWHEFEATVESREPIDRCDITISYRIFGQYTDAGDRRIDRVEPFVHRTADEYRRGIPAVSRVLDTSDPVQAAVAALMWADVKSDSAKREIANAIEQHQRDRDDDLEAAGYQPSSYALAAE